MDGKGRATDNIWIERFWKSIKHDYVYLNPAEDGFELYQGIEEYMAITTRRPTIPPGSHLTNDTKTLLKKQLQDP